MSQPILRVGTRSSLLARTQTEGVIAQLRALHPDREIVTVLIQTSGDLHRDVPFAQVGTKGMFVKEIEQALLDGQIELGVHSLKDMPGTLPDGLTLAWTPEREDPRDALLSRNGETLATLRQGAVVGTSSIRRQAQLRAVRPDLQITELRGNLDTRLRKLDNGDYDAIILACAGLHRLGLSERITERLPPEICLPAVGQGALALESREADTEMLRLLEPLNHPDTAVTIRAERAFQAAFQGGCSVPAGALAEVSGERLTLRGLIAAPDGSVVLRESETALLNDAEPLGRRVAERLLQRGGSAYVKG